VLDADIQGFFDNLDKAWMIKFVEHRVADRRILRLIQKWLKAGVMEEGKWSDTERGTPQGSVISPLLANNLSPLCLRSLDGHLAQEVCAGRGGGRSLCGRYRLGLPVGD
jgi:retron-type reverse transcriptase